MLCPAKAGAAWGAHRSAQARASPLPPEVVNRVFSRIGREAQAHRVRLSLHAHLPRGCSPMARTLLPGALALLLYLAQGAAGQPPAGAVPTPALGQPDDVATRCTILDVLRGAAPHAASFFIQAMEATQLTG